MLSALAVLAFAAWVYLLVGRGFFWRADAWLGPPRPTTEGWPEVAAVIPARNEAGGIAAAVAGVLGQDYPGRLALVVVDDASDDDTAARAEAATSGLVGERGFALVRGEGPPAGWTGKVAAMALGGARAGEIAPDARYLWLTDGDVAHGPGVLRALVARAERRRLDLTSLMVRLRCESVWERLMIPAFVFFFQKLYPFPWVNEPDRPTAAAAGGCMLLARAALERIGGFERIKDAVIDDVALAAAVKRGGGRIWLGLAEESVSLRRYETLDEIWQMVARSAFAQLRYSWALLVIAVIGMAILYVVPPVAVLGGFAAGSLTLFAFGAASWAVMAVAYAPTLALYRRPPAEALTLPVAAAIYIAITVDSGMRHARGRRPAWRGRGVGDDADDRDER